MGNSICHNWRFRRPRWSTIPAGSAHSCSKLWRVPDITHNITKADRNASSWLTVSGKKMQTKKLFAGFKIKSKQPTSYLIFYFVIFRT